MNFPQETDLILAESQCSVCCRQGALLTWGNLCSEASAVVAALERREFGTEGPL